MFLFNRISIKSFNCIARLYSLGKKCPYDVLRLRRNCTDKEIKEAFIKMSKEQYHPDKNKDAKAQERFVSIVEAYNVLGKPSSRAQYDILSMTQQSTYVQRTHVPWNLRNNPSYQYQYQNTQSNQRPRQERSYYGVTGVKKMPNYMIIMICFGFALVGLVIQMYVIRHSFLIHRDNIDLKSRIAAEELDKVRAAADENGNESQVPEIMEDNPSASVPDPKNDRYGDLEEMFGDLILLLDGLQVEELEESKSNLLDAVLRPENEVEVQTRLLLEKIVSGANPTVATASLGQALASEKKESPGDRVLTEYGLSGDAGGDWYKSSFRSSIKFAVVKFRLPAELVDASVSRMA